MKKLLLDQMDQIVIITCPALFLERHDGRRQIDAMKYSSWAEAGQKKLDIA